MKKRKLEFSKILTEQIYSNLHSKYGKFVIQTNYVQSLLVFLVFFRSPIRSKTFKKNLSSLTLGNLISHFRVCAKNIPLEVSILSSLDTYNNSRNALAHKMMTDKALTERECELSIELGAKLTLVLEGLFKRIISTEEIQ